MGVEGDQQNRRSHDCYNVEEDEVIVAHDFHEETGGGGAVLWSMPTEEGQEADKDSGYPTSGDYDWKEGEKGF